MCEDGIQSTNNLINEPGCILNTKRHRQELKRSKGGSNGSLWDFIGVDKNQMVSAN